MSQDKIETYEEFVDRRRVVGSSSGSDSDCDSTSREQTWQAFKTRREIKANARAGQVGKTTADSEEHRRKPRPT